MPTRRPVPKSVLAAAALVLAACGRANLDSIEDPRERWNASRPAGYAFTLRWSGAVPLDYRSASRITVDGDTVVSVADPDTGGPTRGPRQSIDDLFALIATERARGAYRVDVRYHADLGYPVTAELVESASDPSNARRFEVSDFQAR